METKIIKVTATDNKILQKAAELIRDGEVVAFPTETVYGLGANGLDAKASAKIYKAKGRPSDNPLILHICNTKMLAMVTDGLPQMALKIMTAFCPGPLTLVIRKKETVPDSITGGLATVGVRMPGNAIARKFIKLSGVPIAAPSANISGRPSPTTASAVYHDMKGRIPLILDGGASDFGVESTIIDCTEAVPVILRPGAVTKEMLEEIFDEVKIDPALTGKNEVPKAPGMKYRHYAPKAPMIVFEGEYTKVVSAMQNELKKYTAAGQKVGIIASSETLKDIGNNDCYDYGSRDDLYSIAANIYNALLYFDEKNSDIILAEGTPQDGIGLAIMNRLQKASGQNIIHV